MIESVIQPLYGAYASFDENKKGSIQQANSLTCI
jgi:Ca2+-binding EF-hand superfamily protein